ncbi:hypothetical protein TW78_09860 [Vibrio coralliilyticus]|uniref:Uncharacterized protein n=1 Tax=Vibrio coralliilyticus TaxID=190893 RepID=A0A837GAS8_9VIBR|nr:hypothetical protein [Vibrio coralliilyticus]KJY73466.1 hypothetical protein TW78_09860 [Vibrio coralliilyticus]QOU33263.1 hypothetical protein TW71_024020 [Vibrio coralliilyticus]
MFNIKKRVVALPLMALFGSPHVFAQSWYLEDVSVEMADGSSSCTIYANGNQQCHVVIGFSTEGDEEIPIEEVLAKTKLWDKVGDQDLTTIAGYQVSQTDDKWIDELHTMSAQSEAPEQLTTQSAEEWLDKKSEQTSYAKSDMQYFKLYVSTENTEPGREICVQIEDSAGPYSTCGYDGGAVSTVHITGTEPIKYDLASMVLNPATWVYGEGNEVNVLSYMISTGNGAPLVDYTLYPNDQGQGYYNIYQDYLSGGGPDKSSPLIGQRIFQRYWDKDVYCNVMATIWEPAIQNQTTETDVKDHYKADGAPLHSVPIDLETNSSPNNIHVLVYRNVWDNEQWRYYTNYNTDRPVPIVFTDAYGNNSDVLALDLNDEYGDLMLSYP